ncbi:hypothetical protein TPA0905_51520 [Streptomyces olivaceus]|nr:hypothetical protein TPA0905_51520 [Streptomyces olivaceus]
MRPWERAASSGRDGGVSVVVLLLDMERLVQYVREGGGRTAGNVGNVRVGSGGAVGAGQKRPQSPGSRRSATPVAHDADTPDAERYRPNTGFRTPRDARLTPVVTPASPPR